MIAASSLLDLSGVASTLLGYIAPAAAAGLAIMAALYGVRVIRRSFKEAAGVPEDYGIDCPYNDPDQYDAYCDLSDMWSDDMSDADQQAWRDLMEEHFPEMIE